MKAVQGANWNLRVCHYCGDQALMKPRAKKCWRCKSKRWKKGKKR